MTGNKAVAPSLLKRPVVLASFAIAAAAAAGIGAWVTRAPEETPKAMTAAPVENAGTTAAPPPAAPAMPGSGPIDWAALPVGDLTSQAEANGVAAMEELARRLMQGIGVPVDRQAGADWLLRAAQAGSAQSAFDVAAMYERGVVMERNAAQAIAWYRLAVEANLAVAKHNLALMLRDGRGAARDGRKAVELLQSAARQGMAASMFGLGDIYERGDAAPRDAAMAMAWFTIAAEFERQTRKGAETALARTSAARAQALQRGLTPEDLQKAELAGQQEFRQIVEALQEPTKSPPSSRPAAPPPDADSPGWPKAANDQIRAIQQMLFDLKLLSDKPDGALGPMTRAAIRKYQGSAGLKVTGLASRELFDSLKEKKLPAKPGPGDSSN